MIRWTRRAVCRLVGHRFRLTYDLEPHESCKCTRCGLRRWKTLRVEVLKCEAWDALTPFRNEGAP